MTTMLLYCPLTICELPLNPFMDMVPATYRLESYDSGGLGQRPLLVYNAT